MNSPSTKTCRKVLRPAAVMDKTGYGRTQIWRKSRDPDDDFPAAIKLGDNAIGWFEDELEAWLPPKQCSVRRGALLAQIELVHEEPRFGLAVPELARVPDALPPAREAWLAELCRATQVHWRLARLTTATAGRTEVPCGSCS